MELGGKEAILKDSPFTEFMHLLFAKIPGIPSSPPDISLSRLSQEVNSRKGLFKCWVHLTWVAPSIWIEEDRSLAFFTKKVNYLNICCLKATEGQGKQLQLIRRGVCRSPAGQAAKGGITSSPPFCPQPLCEITPKGPQTPAMLETEALLVVFLNSRSTKGQQKALRVELALPTLPVLKRRWKSLLPSEVMEEGTTAPQSVLSTTLG